MDSSYVTLDKVMEMDYSNSNSRKECFISNTRFCYLNSINVAHTLKVF